MSLLTPLNRTARRSACREPHSTGGHDTLIPMMPVSSSVSESLCVSRLSSRRSRVEAGGLRRGEELGEGVVDTGVPALDEAVGVQQQCVSRVELDLTLLVLGLSERAEQETAEHGQ